MSEQEKPPELLPCEHCGIIPLIERAESGVIWIALIRHTPKCFWARWMSNAEQVILERGFEAWNTRADLAPAGERVAELESGLTIIRDMCEKAGANQHARYCYDIARRLLEPKGTKA